MASDLVFYFISTLTSCSIQSLAQIPKPVSPLSWLLTSFMCHCLPCTAHAVRLSFLVFRTCVLM